MLTLELVKEQAYVLKKFLAAKGNLITHSSCLQVIALMNGYKDWNVLSAILTKKDNSNETTIN